MKKSLAVVAVTLAATAFLRADTIFTTLNGPQTGGFEVAGTNAASGFPAESVAASFSSSSDFLFTGAEVQVIAIGSPTFNMLLFASDSSGLPAPNPILVVATNLMASTASGVVIGTPGTSELLNANTTYWLALTPASDATQVSWGVVQGTPASPFSSTMQTDGLGGWTLRGTQPVEFQIDGTIVQTVSEPSTAILVALALAGGLMLFRQSQNL